tara:strand:+ start:745 stop:939 length:195 start_codon:yes stop_codon:yes gene_type:complete
MKKKIYDKDYEKKLEEKYNNIDWEETKSIVKVINNDINNYQLLERIEKLEKIIILHNEIIEKLK